MRARHGRHRQKSPIKPVHRLTSRIPAKIPPMSDHRVAIVTGAAQGVGLVTAGTLAERGYRTILIDIQSLEGPVAKLSARGWQVDGVVGDISSEEFVRELAERVERHYGAATVLVNNAGISMICPAEQTTTDAWQKVMNVNLLGPFLLSRYLGVLLLVCCSGCFFFVVSFVVLFGFVFCCVFFVF